MLVLLGFAFLSGLVTILAPCIWPLLPIVLSSSISGSDHKRPLGITLGVMVSFTIFTLGISYLVSIFHFDPNNLRLVAVIVISILGLTILIPQLTILFEQAISKLSSTFSTTAKPRSGFWGGFITGLSLGIVWSPCAGPILASIAALASTSQVTLQVVLVTLSYVLGVGIPLFIFAYGGQRIITKSRFLSKYTPRIQQAFGVIMILTAIAIYTNYDKVIQVKLLDLFPQFSQSVNSFESNKVVTDQLLQLNGGTAQTPTDSTSLLNANTPAPEFTGITQWLNPPTPLTMESLKGKVVLIDFWTYTCINCIRTLPYVTSWYDKYKDKGFVVIGVHTPEFAFEKETKNVAAAIKQYNIHYPVAQDNDYKTWSAYNNLYWPAEYLIDSKGVIRRTHFGEGEYDKMEEAIQELLKESGQTVNANITELKDQTPVTILSPETYLGSKRMMYLEGSGKIENGDNTFPPSSSVSPNHFALGGNWTIFDEYAQSGQNATLSYNFTAGHVYLVLKPGNVKNGVVTVLLNGKLITSEEAGKDISNGRVTVDSDRLYELVALPKPGNGILQLQFQSPGIQAYAFTFGD